MSYKFVWINVCTHVNLFEYMRMLVCVYGFLKGMNFFLFFFGPGAFCSTPLGPHTLRVEIEQPKPMAYFSYIKQGPNLPSGPSLGIKT